SRLAGRQLHAGPARGDARASLSKGRMTVRRPAAPHQPKQGEKTMNPPRRVITGLDAEGRSCLLLDGPSSMVIWSTDEALADNGGTADAGGGVFRFPASGTLFCFADFPPGGGTDMHATDTIDYIVVISG